MKDDTCGFVAVVVLVFVLCPKHWVCIIYIYILFYFFRGWGGGVGFVCLFVVFALLCFVLVCCLFRCLVVVVVVVVVAVVAAAAAVFAKRQECPAKIPKPHHSGC